MTWRLGPTWLAPEAAVLLRFSLLGYGFLGGLSRLSPSELPPKTSAWVHRALLVLLPRPRHAVGAPLPASALPVSGWEGGRWIRWKMDCGWVSRSPFLHMSYLHMSDRPKVKASLPPSHPSLLSSLSRPGTPSLSPSLSLSFSFCVLPVSSWN